MRAAAGDAPRPPATFAHPRMTGEQRNVLLATCLASFLPPVHVLFPQPGDPGDRCGVQRLCRGDDWVVTAYLVASAAWVSWRSWSASCGPPTPFST
jgi:hypothetical protein